MTMIFGFKFIDREDRKILATPGLRVVFEWLGDRWTNALEIADDSQMSQRERDERYWAFWSGDEVAANVTWLRVAEAIEGADNPRSIVSPVYQDFHWQANARGGCGMLLGQSGPHHFSAVLSASSTATTRIDFDIADRCREDVDALATTYQIAALASELIDAGPGHAAWDWTEKGRLDVWTLSGGVAVAEGGARGQRAQISASPDPSNQTHRIRYWWTWSPRTTDDRKEQKPR
jgi:hypothetical protein